MGLTLPPPLDILLLCSEYEQLEEIVKLAAQPLPERPDGIVAVAKYTSATLDSCRTTEAEYERLARDNPASIFLRCFQEYDNADILIGKANIQNWPTFDLFYGGNRVARVEGPAARHDRLSARELGLDRAHEVVVIDELVAVPHEQV